MKTLGLIGGTGWATTVEYYTFLNQEINRRLGGHQFARCVIYSLNFQDVIQRMDSDMSVLPLLGDAADRLIAAGADGLVLCANTMHQYADALQNQISVPILHIAVQTADKIKRAGVSRVGLIGTRYTMEMDFFKSKLSEKGLVCVIPDAGDRSSLHTVIMEELARGRFTEPGKVQTLKIIRRLEKKGIQGLILGCTEFPILLKGIPFSYPVFDTLHIHAMAAVDFMLNPEF
jgi:aspartate racemase